MPEQNRGITVAMSLLPALYWVGVTVFVVSGLACTGLCVFAVWDAGLWGILLAVLLLPWCILFFQQTLYFLIQAAGLLHLMPESISLRLFGRELFAIPAGKLGGLYVVQIRAKNGTLAKYLGVSGCSLSDFTQLREEQLKKGVFSRHELKYRKRRPDWQQKFAEEYLIRQCKWAQAFPIFRKILWLPWSEDLLALLQQCYPQAPVERVSEKSLYKPFANSWKDRQSTCFCRGLQKKPGIPAVVLVFVLIVCVWPVAFLPFSPEVWPLAVMYAVFMTALFGGGLLLGLPESDEISLLPEGIRIRRGKKEVLLPRSGLQTIVHRLNAYPLSDLRICLPEREACVEQQILWLQKSRNRRIWLQALQQLPDGEERLFKGFCNRFHIDLGNQLPPVQWIAYTPDRAEALRQMYPEVSWLEID